MNPRLRAGLYDLRYWLFPGGLLVGAAVLWLHLEPESPLLAEVVTGYPWAVYSAGLLLAWRLRRSRIAAALTLVVGMAGVLPRLPDPASRPAVDAARIVAPLLLAVVALFEDRAALSRKGLVPVLLVVGLGGVVGMGLWTAPSRVGEWANWALPVRRTPWSIPLSVLAPTVAGAALLIATLLRRGAVERALLWTLAAVLLALAAQPFSVAGALHLMVAGVILSAAVVESSYFMAFHDELTGLPGRRALSQELDRLSGRYTLAMVDVDHFKRFNDRHGHEVGDQVLRMVATCLRQAPGGRAFRYGGEEFTLVYRDTSLDRAKELLERVREAVEGARFTVRAPGRFRRGKKGRGAKTEPGTKLSVSVSVGAAQAGKTADSPDAVLERADQALYRAKEKGRNRVEI